MDIINKKEQNILNLKQSNPMVIDPELSLLNTIKKLSKLVGESVPIIENSNQEFIGIISENDVLEAYLEISNEINHIEKD